MDAVFAENVETGIQVVIKRLAHSIKHLHKTDDIMGNLITLGFCLFIAIVLQIKWLISQLNHYHSYVMVGVAILASIQIIRSAQCSLLLPTLCILISLPLLITNHYKLIDLGEFLLITQGIIGLGLLGLCRMILNIR